jgi:adenylate cyclase class 2
MAFDNIEIELKFRVTESLFSWIHEHLKASAVSKAQIRQVDHYFVPSGRDFLKEEYPFEWLSIRERGDRCILNYKHFFPERAEKHSHCNEYECVISDPQKMTKIFEALDITCVVSVDKLRETFELENAEIVLDRVTNLGAFVEIEATKQHGSIANTRQDLIEIAKRLRLDSPEAMQDFRGYPFLLLAQKGK